MSLATDINDYESKVDTLIAQETQFFTDNPSSESDLLASKVTLSEAETQLDSLISNQFGSMHIRIQKMNICFTYSNLTEDDILDQFRERNDLMELLRYGSFVQDSINSMLDSLISGAVSISVQTVQNVIDEVNQFKSDILSLSGVLVILDSWFDDTMDALVGMSTTFNPLAPLTDSLNDSDLAANNSILNKGVSLYWQLRGEVSAGSTEEEIARYVSENHVRVISDDLDLATNLASPLNSLTTLYTQYSNWIL